MTTLAVASGFLGRDNTDTNSFFTETLDPERVKQSIRKAFNSPMHVGASEDPSVLLARAMIAHQKHVASLSEQDSGNWFGVASEALTKLGDLGSVLGHGLMVSAGRAMIRALLGVSRILVRAMVQIAWIGIRGVFRLLVPFIVGNPLLAAAIAASISGYLVYRQLKNKDDLSGSQDSDRVWTPRTVHTTAKDLGLEEAAESGQDYVGGESSVRVGNPPRLPSHVVALANQTADRYGINRADFLTYVAIESGGKNVSRGEKSAKGLLQFIPSTAKMYGIDGMEMDEAANLDAGARLYLDNARMLKAQGVAPTITNLYLAHQQGAGAVKQLISAANSGLRVDELPDRLRRNVRNNLYGNSEYVSQYVGATQAKLMKWSSIYASSGVGSSTEASTSTLLSGEAAVQAAVDTQVKPRAEQSTPASPLQLTTDQHAVDPIRLANGVVVDAAR